MIFTLDSHFSDIIESEKGRIVIEKYLPLFRNYPNINPCKDLTLRDMVREKHLGINAELADLIIKDLNKPIYSVFPEVVNRKSLDEIDRESFGPCQPYLHGEFIDVELKETVSMEPANNSSVLYLDGIWQMAYADDGNPDGAFTNPLPAKVPGSIHAALTEAGKIPDTTFGRNQEIGCKESYKDWWLKCSFARPQGLKDIKLVFEGICNKCDIWLNGIKLGTHEGMFGMPEYSISSLLKDENTLTVKLYAIPYVDYDPSESKRFNPGNNKSWKYTVVFNNVYGWHYTKMPSLGIWRSVKLIGIPDVSIENPFIATESIENGTMKLKVPLKSKSGSFSGTLYGTVAPENFDGREYSFAYPVSSESDSTDILLRFNIPQHKLWWPVDLGEPNLYKLTLSFIPDNAEGDTKSFNFGIRTVEMAPLPCGPNPEKYNWTFIINGHPHFVKGSGWCTLDALMDFSRERYDRYLTLCRLQHVQLLRAWGSGMPETDDFYDLCDHYGIMVIQEWPTAGDSHETQPYDMLEETVRVNTPRLRNHASLVMWGAGNEIAYPYGKAIDMMGRCSIELDGTRPFHRGEPWGRGVITTDPSVSQIKGIGDAEYELFYKQERSSCRGKSKYKSRIQYVIGKAGMRKWLLFRNRLCLCG